MMVSPISSVRFCANETPKVDLVREGAHSKSASANPAAAASAAEEGAKKSSTGKKVLKTVIGLAVVAGVLAALPKMFKNAIKVIPEADWADAGIMKKAGHYLATVGEKISDYTYRPILKLIHSSKTAEEIVTNATTPDAAAAVAEILT